MVSAYKVGSFSCTPAEVLIVITIRSPGQTKLKQSSVIVVGAGGLGCPALQYLAAAGVGEFTHFYFLRP